MIKGKGKFMMALLVLAMSLTLITPIAFADQLASGEIPVKISLTGTPPEVEESYKILMKASNKDFPMPEGSEEGIYSMEILGANTGNLPKIEFSSIGVYSYEIWQEEGDSVLVDEYDDSVYNLVVYVTNREDMEGLEVAVLLYRPEETTKFDEIEFINSYALVAGEEDEDDEKEEDEEKEDKDDEEEEEVILVAGEDDLDDKLPKTGSGSNTLYFLLGSILLLLGLVTIFRRNTAK